MVSRVAFAAFLGAESPSEIHFGANMTALTADASSLLAQRLEPGDCVVVTDLDHDANIAPWRKIAVERQATVLGVGLDPQGGLLDMAGFHQALERHPKIVAFGYASNVIGTVNPVKSMLAAAKQVGALTFVDAVHWAPHGPIDVQELGVDFLACSVYKFFGPHLGVLYARAGIINQESATPFGPSDQPFEKGTPNFEAIAGARACVQYLESIGRESATLTDDPTRLQSEMRTSLRRAMRAIRSYEMRLFDDLIDQLSSIRRVRVLGLTDKSMFAHRTPTAALTIEGADPHHVATSLASQSIRAGHGSFYAPTLIAKLGLAPHGILRLGVCHYTTPAEVSILIDALRGYCENR